MQDLFNGEISNIFELIACVALVVGACACMFIYGYFGRKS